MEIKVLDHGYVKFIESWGSDARIIEAARMSTNKGFQGWGPIETWTCVTHGNVEKDEVYEAEGGGYGHAGGCWCRVEMGETTGDEKLLKYLWENKHATPFEMAGLVIEVQAPILVFREWHRHRTQSYNELSARYTSIPDVNYVPTVERLMINAGGSNKQAGTVEGAQTLTKENAEAFREEVERIYNAVESEYQLALQVGVPKELARIIIPVGRYSRMRAQANLRNWLQFLTLRMAPNAQWEIRQYANAVGELIAKTFPRTWELFIENK